MGNGNGNGNGEDGSGSGAPRPVETGPITKGGDKKGETRGG